MDLKSRWCDEHNRPFERLSNRNVACPECYNRKRRAKYAKKKEGLREQQASARFKRVVSGKTRKWRVKYNEDLKREAFKAYGGVRCRHCDEDRLHRLALDHVNDDGHEHRMKTKRSGTKLYSWLRTHDWPSGYQVLCHNCNIIKRSERYALRATTRKRMMARKRQDFIKETVLTHYGGGKPACVRCGIDNLVALTIDHVNDDGHLTRGQVKPGYGFYLSLMRDGFPDGFQTLCFCCNMEKEIRLRR